MTLSNSSVGADNQSISNTLENAIVQETNVGRAARLTYTPYVIPEPARTPPRENASFGEILDYLSIGH